MTGPYRCLQCQQPFAVANSDGGSRTLCPACRQALAERADGREGAALASLAATPDGNPFADEARGAPLVVNQAAGSAAVENPYASPSPVADEEAPGARVERTPLAATKTNSMRLLSSTHAIVKQHYGACAVLGLLYAVAWYGLRFGAVLVRETATLTGMGLELSPVGLIAIRLAGGLAGEMLAFVGGTFLQLASGAFALQTARSGVAGFEAVYAASKYYARSLLLGLLIVVPQFLAIALIVAVGLIWTRRIFGREGAEAFQFAVILISVIPALWIALATYLGIYFVIDRNLGALASLRNSWRYMRRNFLSLLATLAVVWLLGGLFSIVTCGAGVIALMAYLQILGAVFYLHATGQKSADEIPHALLAA